MGSRVVRYGIGMTPWEASVRVGPHHALVVVCPWLGMCRCQAESGTAATSLSHVDISTCRETYLEVGWPPACTNSEVGALVTVLQRSRQVRARYKVTRPPCLCRFYHYTLPKAMSTLRSHALSDSTMPRRPQSRTSAAPEYTKESALSCPEQVGVIIICSQALNWALGSTQALAAPLAVLSLRGYTLVSSSLIPHSWPLSSMPHEGQVTWAAAISIAATSSNETRRSR